MEALSRQEYPAMLVSLQPAQAVSTLNERIKSIGRVNAEIADWLLERRKVEETYVLGLKKLVHKQPPDSHSELGIFTTPWQRIIAGTESIAQSHQTFASNIEKDVEQPLRNFATKNREMQAMSTIQGNLTAIQKELDEAQVRADKLGKKGAKAKSLKVDNASQKLENANSQWDSQAPFVFERLQAVDESRLDHLRDVLTQYQTHEADQVERSRVTAETTLNSLLEVETAQEIRNFAKNVTQGKPKLDRNTRRASSSAGSNTIPPPPVSKVSAEDGGSENSGKNEGSSESKGGLRRFGTMLGRRRQSMHGSFVRAPSPPKGFSPFGRAPGSREGRPTPSPRGSSSNLRDTPSRDNRLSSLAESPTSERRQSKDVTNGEFSGFKPGSLLNPEVVPPKTSASDNVNGTASKEIDLSDVKPPPGPPPSHQKNIVMPSTQRDSEGFTVPTAFNDPISQAQQEAANEADQPQFKVDIKKEPIREEDADTQTAISNVTNTLRSSTLPTPSRKAGTVRGRRDVRNTIYVPAPDALENDMQSSPAQSLGSPRPPAFPTLSSEHSASDTQSIRSARSLAGGSVVKHPDMHQPGLNSSIVETVSAFFENGEIKTCAVIGEIAFAYGHAESTSSLSTETIRLNNFPVLEAIAPNYAFVKELSNDKREEYMVNVSLLSRTVVAFRYKVHIDETNLAAHAPLILKPAWKLQGEKLLVVIEYKLNPAFATASVALHNLVLIATYEGARVAGCQTKPTGTHLKDRSLIYWRLGDVTLDGTMQKVIGRLVGAEGGEPKPGVVEARWELPSSEHAFGSGLGVSRLDTLGKGKEKMDRSDPFADESASSSGNWVEVESLRKIISGKYDAKQVDLEAA